MTLEAEETTETPRVFRSGTASTLLGWKPSIPPGTVNLTMLSNGGNTVLLGTPGSSNVKIGYLSVPNPFELRTLGL